MASKMAVLSYAYTYLHQVSILLNHAIGRNNEVVYIKQDWLFAYFSGSGVVGTFADVILTQRVGSDSSP